MKIKDVALSWQRHAGFQVKPCQVWKKHHNGWSEWYRVEVNHNSRTINIREGDSPAIVYRTGEFLDSISAQRLVKDIFGGDVADEIVEHAVRGFLFYL